MASPAPFQIQQRHLGKAILELCTVDSYQPITDDDRFGDLVVSRQYEEPRTPLRTFSPSLDTRPLRLALYLDPLYKLNTEEEREATAETIIYHLCIQLQRTLQCEWVIGSFVPALMLGCLVFLGHSSSAIWDDFLVPDNMKLYHELITHLEQQSAGKLKTPDIEINMIIQQALAMRNLIEQLILIPRLQPPASPLGRYSHLTESLIKDTHKIMTSRQTVDISRKAGVYRDCDSHRAPSQQHIAILVRIHLTMGSENRMTPRDEWISHPKLGYRNIMSFASRHPRHIVNPWTLRGCFEDGVKEIQPFEHGVARSAHLMGFVVAMQHVGPVRQLLLEGHHVRGVRGASSPLAVDDTSFFSFDWTLLPERPVTDRMKEDEKREKKVPKRQKDEEKKAETQAFLDWLFKRRRARFPDSQLQDLPQQQEPQHSEPYQFIPVQSEPLQEQQADLPKKQSTFPLSTSSSGLALTRHEIETRSPKESQQTLNQKQERKCTKVESISEDTAELEQSMGKTTSLHEDTAKPPPLTPGKNTEDSPMVTPPATGLREAEQSYDAVEDRPTPGESKNIKKTKNTPKSTPGDPHTPSFRSSKQRSKRTPR